MRNAPRFFSETLFDWNAEPANQRTRTLFQPKGLGTVLPFDRRRNASRRAVTTLIAALALGAGVVAVMAFARYFHLGLY